MIQIYGSRFGLKYLKLICSMPEIISFVTTKTIKTYGVKFYKCVRGLCSFQKFFKRYANILILFYESMVLQY